MIDVCGDEYLVLAHTSVTQSDNRIHITTSSLIPNSLLARPYIERRSPHRVWGALFSYEFGKQETIVRHKNIQYDGGAGGEATADKLDLTPDLVRRAETKLVGLHANRSQLRRRIRALHYLLRTLDTKLSLSKLTAPASHPKARKSNFNHDQRSEVERNSGTAGISSFGSINTTTVSAVIGVSTELRRACRIALMESDRPQPCEQILQRIRR